MQPSNQTTTDEPMYETIRKLADVLLPERIGLSDVKDHLRGYKKAKAVEEVVERARQDPLITKIKIYLVYSELQTLFNNGGL